MNEKKPDEPRGSLSSSDASSMESTLTSMGLKRLNRSWAKLEILLGVSAAVLGFKLLGEDSPLSWAGGILSVLGVYLAMAGNRSHLYQSMNHQTSLIVQILEHMRTQSRAEE